MDKREQYTRNQERIKERALYKLLSEQKKSFIELLLAQEKKSICMKELWYVMEKKSFESDLDAWIKQVAPMIPNYLKKVLPNIMREGAKEPIKRYEKLLPEGYSMAFDVDSSPSAQYIRDLEDLYLSQRQGSILKTTRDELRRIIADGVEQGNSYGEIAKQIEMTDPFVFSKYRAKLIAVNEVGRAYGWANHEPGNELVRQGYVLQKIWQTKHDDRVRTNHVINESAGYIPFELPFPGTQDQFAPSTHDINCRCVSAHAIVGIQKNNIIHDVKGLSVDELQEKYLQLNCSGV